jgi:hypothetical protein
MKYQKIDKNGDHLTDDDDIVRDGQSLRVPIMLMDAASRAPADASAITARILADQALPTVLHRPGALAVVTDAERNARDQLYAARDRRVADAWKNTRAPIAAPAAQTAPALSAVALTADSEARYARRDQRLRDAWRMGAA